MSTPQPQQGAPIADDATAGATLVSGIDDLVVTLQGFRYRFSSESDLQEGIEKVLRACNISYVREHSLSDTDRPDFIVGSLGGDIALEVKTKGTFAQLLRQAARYAAHPRVSAVLAVGSPRWLDQMPTAIDGTPVRALRLLGSLL